MSARHLPLTPDWLLWADPWVWALLAIPLLLPLLWWLWLNPRRRVVVRYSAVAAVRAAGGSWRSHLRLLLPLLRSAALVGLIIAVARPQRADQSSVIYAEGVAIQFVVDVSGSMSNPDLDPQGRRTRLDVAKDLFLRFVQGDTAELTGRPNDLVGVVTFARYPDHVCPLTLDRDALVKLTRSITTVNAGFERAESELANAATRAYPTNPQGLLRELNRRGLLRGPSELDVAALARTAEELRIPPGELRAVIGAYAGYEQLAGEDGTAIGDGLALAVERLRDLRRATGSNTELKIKSKVVVLLTDGENNAGAVTPEQAAELAATYGVRVYSILVGRDESNRGGAAGLQAARRDLTTIAETTGGKFYRARDSGTLAAVYAEIDGLERTKVEERSYVRLSELSGPFLLIAFGALVSQWLLDATLLRKL